MMQQRIGQVAIVVRDYDEAIEFYTAKLNFRLQEDTDLGDGKRWVTILPPGTHDTGLLLAKGVNDVQISRVGNQTGGRVFLFLHTDDFDRDYNAMQAKNVNFISEPRIMPYGKVAVFEDLYGNKWDLIGPFR